MVTECLVTVRMHEEALVAVSKACRFTNMSRQLEIHDVTNLLILEKWIPFWLPIALCTLATTVLVTECLECLVEVRMHEEALVAVSKGCRFTICQDNSEYTTWLTSSFSKSEFHSGCRLHSVHLPLRERHWMSCGGSHLGGGTGSSSYCMQVHSNVKTTLNTRSDWSPHSRKVNSILMIHAPGNVTLRHLYVHTLDSPW